MALLEQQAILENITEHLISNLRVRVKTSGFEPVDLFEWYIWTTFDLIGEISFGEPFDCLKLARFIELIRFVLNVFKTFAIVNIRYECTPPCEKGGYTDQSAASSQLLWTRLLGS